MLTEKDIEIISEQDDLFETLTFTHNKYTTLFDAIQG